MKAARAALVLVLGLALMVLGFAGVAEAQGYGSGTPLSVSASVNSNGAVTGQITGGTAPYSVTATITADGTVTSVTATINSDGSYSLPAGSVPAGGRVLVQVTDGASSTASATAGNGVSLADAIKYPGPFNASPAHVAPEFRTPLAPKSPAAAAGTGGDAKLAFTGAQSSTLVVGGMSLVLVGGVAVLATRKRPEA